MGLNTNEFQQYFKPWFGNVPQNAKKASVTLTFTGVTSDGETVTITDGTTIEIYEFDTNASVTAGHIRVNVGGGNSASQSVTALALAITNNSTIVTGVDGASDTVVIASKSVGTEGNSITVAETCANANFGGETNLSNGQYATPCSCPNSFIILSGVWYYTAVPVDKYNETAWKSITPVLVS